MAHKTSSQLFEALLTLLVQHAAEAQPCEKRLAISEAMGAALAAVEALHAVSCKGGFCPREGAKDVSTLLLTDLHKAMEGPRDTTGYVQ